MFSLFVLVVITPGLLALPPPNDVPGTTRATHPGQTILVTPDLRTHVAKMEQALHNMQLLSQTREQKYSALMAISVSELRTMTAELKALRTEHAHTADELTALKTAHAHTTDELTALKTAHAHTTDELTALHNSTAIKLAALKTEVNHEYEALSALNTNQTHTVQTLTIDTIRLRKGVDMCVSNLFNFSTKFHEVDSKLNLMNTIVSSAQSDRTALGDQLTSLKNHLSEARSWRHTFNTSIELLESSFWEMKSETNSSKEHLSSEIESVRQHLEHGVFQIITNLTTVTGKMVALEHEMNSSKNRVKAIQRLIANTPASSRKDIGFEAVVSLRVEAIADTEIHFTDIPYNSGGGYNILTAKFTAPVAGTYMFWAVLRVAEKDGIQPKAVIHTSNLITGTGTMMKHTVTDAAVPIRATGVINAIGIDYVHQGQVIWCSVHTNVLIRKWSSFGGVLLNEHTRQNI